MTRAMLIDEPWIKEFPLTYQLKAPPAHQQLLLLKTTLPSQFIKAKNIWDYKSFRGRPSYASFKRFLLPFGPLVI